MNGYEVALGEHVVLNNIFLLLDDENNSTEDGEEDGDEVYEVVASPRLARRDSPDPVARKTVRHDSPEAGPLRKMCPDSPDTKSSRITRHDSPDLSPRRQGKQQKGNSRGETSMLQCSTPAVI